jgi:hypothetical protein
MRLTDEEAAFRNGATGVSGAAGPVCQWAIEQQSKAGTCLGAEDFVPVSQAHIKAQGAALADFTMMSGFATDITQAVPDGAIVEVDPEADPPCVRILTS